MFEVKATAKMKMECSEPPTDVKAEVNKETIVKQENNNKLSTSYNKLEVKIEINDPFDCSSDESSCENDEIPFGEDTNVSKSEDSKETSKVNINTVNEKAPILIDKAGRMVLPPSFFKKHYTVLPSDEYSCKYCKHVFKKRKYMNKHLKTIHLKIGKVYQCPYCPYNARFNITSHITSVHKEASEIQWYTCHECGHKSKLRSAFQRHVLTHRTAEEKMAGMKKCDLCPKTFTDQTGLRNHIRKVHEKAKQEVFKCGTCDYQSSLKYTMERHIKRFHTDDENLEMLRCDKCNYTTAFDHLLKAHSKRKHFLKMLQCEKCPYQTHDKPHMKLHMINHQEVINEADLKYRCDKCDYKTYRHYNFKIHKLKHLKPEEIEYFYCYHCDFKAKRKDNLKTHIQNHFKKKDDFVCFVCDFKTKNKVTYLAHIDNEHSKKQKEAINEFEKQLNEETSITSSKGRQKKAPSTGIKKNSKGFHTDDENLEMLRCDKCNYTTAFDHLLKAHSKRKHLLKMLQCEKCPYKTHDKPHMQLHMIYHQEVKNEADLKYRCDKCDYKTYRHYNFKIHKLKHLKPEEIEYFYCYHCNFKAKRKDNLKTHIQNHFKKKDDFVCKTKNKVTHLAHIEKHSKEQKEAINESEKHLNKKVSITSSRGPQKKAPSTEIKKNSKGASGKQVKKNRC